MINIIKIKHVDFGSIIKTKIRLKINDDFNKKVEKIEYIFYNMVD